MTAGAPGGPAFLKASCRSLKRLNCIGCSMQVMSLAALVDCMCYVVCLRVFIIYMFVWLVSLAPRLFCLFVVFMSLCVCR